MSKSVVMVMPVLKSGGAERVATLLTNEFNKSGFQTEFLLTSCFKNEVIKGDLNEEIPLIVLQELITEKEKKGLRLLISVLCRCFEMMKVQVPATLACWSFKSQYRNEIKYLREYLVENPDMTVVAFLQPSIPIAVLAAKGLPNKVIISERGDPKRLMKKRYGKPFIEKYYGNVDYAVFQTPEAKDSYPESVAKKGRVIFNPIKDDLPTMYIGERNRIISTFCRISRQKNLPLLVEAFAKFAKEHEDYQLKIIGDAINQDDAIVYDEIISLINEYGIKEKVEMKPFNQNVHDEIVKDAMYVNSSDYEGMSNAMLEAMAIGMPVVCTDCPIGGAHAIIQNEENGMLVPVGDSKAMYLAMKKIVEDKAFADKISHNATKLREELSLENIAKRWMELL